MQERGVEPLRLAAQDPKSCASANSATPAVNSEPLKVTLCIRRINFTPRARARTLPRVRAATHVNRTRAAGGRSISLTAALWLLSHAPAQADRQRRGGGTQAPGGERQRARSNAH